MSSRLPCTCSRRLACSIRRLQTTPSQTSLASWLLPAPRSRSYATAAPMMLRLPDDYIPPTKPPSARPPEVRKSQMLRSYTSLLRSMPLILFFQHNNLTAVEWAAIRRELSVALAKASPTIMTPEGQPTSAQLAEHIQIQVIRTRVFNVALKLVEVFDPKSASMFMEGQADIKYTHDLSDAAFAALKAAKENPQAGSAYEQIEPLLTGPSAIVTFPAVLPQQVAAILSVLSPSPGTFPAPTKKARPEYHDPLVQNGLHKLLLVGGRIEGKVFDIEGIKWLGGIQSGIEGLRAQLIGMLQGAGLGLASVLEGASKSLYLTVQGRKDMLEKDEAGGKEEKA